MNDESEYRHARQRSDHPTPAAQPSDERGVLTPDEVSADSRVHHSGQSDTDPSSMHLDSAVPTGMDDELTAQTTFDPSEGDGDNWSWLAELNRGRGESGAGTDDRKRARQIAGMHRDVDVAADRLHASDHERERVKFLLSRVNAKVDLLQKGAIEAIVVGVVSIVLDERRTRIARQRPDNDVLTSVLRDDAFEALCEDFDVTLSRVRLVRRRLRDTDVYTSPNASQDVPDH